MKTKPLAIVSISSLAVLAFAAGSTHASVIAGWDFSQWAGDGALITDSTAMTFRNNLEANYSDLDPSDGAGAESAGFGTLYFDGQFGSTSVNPAAYPPDFAPTAALPALLASNLDAPAVAGAFNSITILRAEGQDFGEDLAMTAAAPLSVVLKAEAGSPPPPLNHWELSLGARTFEGSSDLDVEFSSDGVSYSPMATFSLTDEDTRFSAPLVAAVTDTAYVRLTLDPSIGQPIIDNVAVILLPEPSMAIQAPVALLSLGVLGFLRRRR
jgi:MYXO-CTERM domain-containing protein